MRQAGIGGLALGVTPRLRLLLVPLVAKLKSLGCPRSLLVLLGFASQELAKISGDLSIMLGFASHYFEVIASAFQFRHTSFPMRLIFALFWEDAESRLLRRVTCVTGQNRQHATPL